MVTTATLGHMEIYDTVPAHTLEVGDQIMVDGDPIEIKAINETEDNDEVVVVGYSHESGDTATYSLFADDDYDLWSI